MIIDENDNGRDKGLKNFVTFVGVPLTAFFEVKK
jgi:hypothetical protein